MKNKKPIYKKPIIQTAIAAVLLIFLLGCNIKVHEDLPKTDDSTATDSGVMSTIQANNQFAIEFYQKINEAGKNLFFSPWSLESALTMTYEGVRGKTADEMQSVLHFPKDQNIRMPSFARLYNLINLEDKDYMLRTANALWAQKGYNFLEEYLSGVEQYYGGKTTNLDFVQETEKSRQTINTWVEEQTNDRIKDLIPLGTVNAATRLVLTNAVYFKADWMTQFKKEDTYEADFKLSSGGTIKAPMMVMRDESHNYAETEQLQALELPYKGEQISMLIILPKEGKMQEVEETLTSEKLNEIRDSMHEIDINVHLPKFKLETKYFLAKTLAEMGMPTAFSTEADFSGMDGSKELFIGDVIHQAFVEVDEEGTEAAAATAIIMEIMIAVPMQFKADHSFIFIIQEKTTGGIIFMGKMENPA